MRLDVYLAEQGLAKSRSAARALIDAGLVTVNGAVAKKAAEPVAGSDSVTVTGVVHPYVGRGGLKLAGALAVFGLSPEGLVCVDIGASTGGFTDCLLQAGAKHVYAVDVGTGQLDPSLVRDARVTNLEKTNARELSRELVPPCDMAVTDVSFISQTLILSAAATVLTDGGVYVGLIKPQFECGPSALGKGGIVRSEKAREAAILRVADAASACGFACMGLAKSPITGGDGNEEFLFYAKKTAHGASFSKEAVCGVVCGGEPHILK